MSEPATAPLVLTGVDAVRAAVGRELGPTVPVLVGPDRVAAFETATGWSALPTGRPTTSAGSASSREVPELLLLSLVNDMLPRLIDVRGFAMGVNYGTGPVRFPTVLPVGGVVLGHLMIAEVADVPGGVQVTYRVTLTAGDTDHQVCVADSLARYLD
ncbi:hypothetical protein I6A60_17800 [Frankia sp. AgB1.9]|uniref:hypothetical protein n=1 Tax=unclassified Frankia TaxID=2632575 RepID=UPI00193339BE|nr:MULTISPECIES: hypothetical protein [unclassified Frankia]MBL7491390.1 hypothetical protein [Frankia sp. AgW1.1]MBL7549715.1 hypothetical protein [Frankia sp. AgB1.9]MBL7620928.1 hypothetical protein [Frankia sp. AgB1.8]